MREKVFTKVSMGRAFGVVVGVVIIAGTKIHYKGKAKYKKKKKEKRENVKA
jgi:hypothetical protein